MSKKKRRTRESSASQPAASSESSQLTLKTLLLLLAPWCGLLAAIRPVSSDDLWWQAARGRQVLATLTTAPSRELLMDERAADVDWLGGVTTYLLYELTGFWGLFVGKLALALAILILLRGLTTRWTAASILLSVFALTLAGPALSLGGRGFGLLFVLLLVRTLAINRDDGGANLRPALWLALTVAMWSNFGPLFAIAPLVVLLFPINVSWRTRVIWVGSVLLAGCVNPRGVLAWLDSLKLSAAWLFETPATLAETPFAPSEMSAGLSMVFITFALVTFALMAGREDPGLAPQRAILWLIAVALGVASAYAIPLSSLLLAAICLHNERRDEWTLSQSGFAWMGSVALLSFGLTGWLGSPHGLGGGLAAKLEPRLFAFAIDGCPRGMAFTWDQRSTGLAAWNGLRPIDAPSRALVGGRLKPLVLAVDDLRFERRNRYLRADQALGGWWLWAHESHNEPLQWIVVSACDSPSLRGLEATGFRPLSIDSPVIPFASAYEPKLVPAIVRSIPIRDVVERQDWTYQRPNHGGLFVDLPDSLGFAQHERWRQAETLWAMHLPIASLRVLKGKSANDLRARCYRDLAAREQRVMGEPSEWTLTVLSRLEGQAESQSEEPLGSAAEMYLNEGPQAALAQLKTQSSPAAMYAAGQMQLEAGGAVDAGVALRALVAKEPADRHAQGARDALRKLP